ncbi:hypothetical protein HMPREF1611_01969, partial [Escherichia coli 908573]
IARITFVKKNTAMKEWLYLLIKRVILIKTFYLTLKISEILTHGRVLFI